MSIYVIKKIKDEFKYRSIQHDFAKYIKMLTEKIFVLSVGIIRTN